jgi:hypothetical protein
MRRTFSDALNADIMQTVKAELEEHGILNVPAVSAAISSRNKGENVALEDVQYAVLHEGQGRNAAMSFDDFDLNPQTMALTIPGLPN